MAIDIKSPSSKIEAPKMPKPPQVKAKIKVKGDIRHPSIKGLLKAIPRLKLSGGGGSDV